MNIAKQSEERLKRVLIADKHFNPEYLKKIVSSDLYVLLNNYAEIRPEDLNFDVSVSKDGDYIFSFKAKSGRLKIFASLPD